MNILNQGHGDGRLIRHVADYCGYDIQACQLGSSPASFSCNDLVFAIRYRAHHDGLHYALGLDAIGQLLQGLGVYIIARLVFPSLDEVDR